MLTTLWGHNYPVGWGICGPLLYSVIIKQILHKVKVKHYEHVKEIFLNKNKPYLSTLINIESQVHPN